MWDSDMMSSVLPFANTTAGLIQAGNLTMGVDNKVVDDAGNQTLALNTMKLALGLDEMMYKEDILEDSLKDPAGFIKARKAKKAEIVAGAGKKYIEYYNSIDKDVPIMRKRELATRMTSFWKDTQLALLEERYPQKIVADTSSRIKNMKAAKNVFGPSVPDLP